MRRFSLICAIIAMIMGLQAQNMPVTEPERTPVVPGQDQILSKELEAFSRARNHPLTHAGGEVIKVGEVTWARAFGETEFYLAPTTNDPPAYFARIRALDNRQEGVVKSEFSIAKLTINENVKQMLAGMGIIVPQYFQQNTLYVMLPQIDIDHLVAGNAEVAVIGDYGKKLSAPGDNGDGSKATIWSEGWEGTLTSYTIGNVSGSANTTWGKISCDKYAGSWSLWCAAAGALPQPHCGTYAPSMNTYVYRTTGVDVLAYTNVQFKYWEKYQTETGYDYFKFLYSQNGTSWTTYLNLNGTSTDYPAWKQHVIGFNGFSTLYWRFDFTSDGSYQFGGAFLDNLEIVGDQGCTSSTQYPATTLTPESHWKHQSAIFAGEYARFAVTSGTLYQWSLCTEHCGLASYDSEITLRRADNDQILAYANDVCGDDARISWTANLTGEVKVVITKYACQSQTTSTRLAYKTGALEDISLSVSPTNRSVTYSSTSTTFSITSNSTWYISGWPAWVTSVTPSSGSGNQTVTVTYEPNNTGGDQRIATLNANLVCGDPVPFTITQAADPGCSSTSQYGGTYLPNDNWRYVSGANAGEFALFSVTSGTTYHWSFCEEHGAYATFDSQLTLRNPADNTNLGWSNNACGDDARISWTATYTGTVKVVVSLYPCNTNTISTRLGYKSGSLVIPALSITPSSRFVDAFEGSTTFNITSNTSWTLSGLPAWATVSQASGMGDATITVAAPGLTSVLFTLNQGFKCNSTSQFPASTLVPANYWKHQGVIFAGEYSLHSVTVGTTYHWSLCPNHGGDATTYDAELTLRNAATDELLAYANGNCSNPMYLGAVISWTATFSGNVKVIVTQYNCQTNGISTCLAYKSGTLTDAALAITPSNRTVGFGSGSTTFSLTANGAWSLSGWPAWVTSVSPTSGTGNATITVNYSSNNTGGPTRMATITAAMGCLITETFTVTQDSDPGCNSSTQYTTTKTPTDNWGFISNIYPGEYSRFNVVSGTQYHWSLCPEHCGDAGYDSELTLRRASDDLYLGFADNTCGNDARLSWTATFTGEVKVIVSENHCENSNPIFTNLSYKTGDLVAATLSVSPSNRNVSAAAGSTTFSITSNATWNISGLPAWITSITPATSGAGNSTITVNYALNATGAQRVANLNVFLPFGCSDNDFTITQGEATTACPSYDYSITPSYTWQTHSASHGTYSGNMYRMSVVGGRTYSFKTGCGDGATADYDTYLELYDPSCNLILWNDDGCETLRSRIDWTADYTGYLYLKVRGLASDWGSYILAYRAEGCLNSVYYLGPYTPLGNWNWVNGIYPGEHSTFNVVAGTQYHWSLCPEHCGDASYDSELTLRKHDDGSFIAFSDDACGDDARISWTATFTGVARVAVTKYPCTAQSISSKLAFKSGALDVPDFSVPTTNPYPVPSTVGTLPYSIVSNQPWSVSGWPAWVTSVTPASGSGNATITVTYSANATGVQREATLTFTPVCGTALTRTLVQGESPTDCPGYDFTIAPLTTWQLHSWSHGTYSGKMYRVNMAANQKVTFKTGCGDGATANYDTKLEFYDSDCNVLDVDDDGCETTRSILTWSVPTAGYYYLKVKGFGSDYGNYTLAYQRCALPAVPGAISGNSTPCQGTANTYSVSPVSGATSYIWNLPAGWSGSSSSNAIVATAGTAGGTIKVKAVNDCGEGFERTLAVTVVAIPAQPGAISGPTAVFQGGTYTYSIAAVPGTTAYSWTLPYGWTGSSATTSISATAGASGGLISVSASNVCGTSPARTLTVTSTAVPAYQTLQNSTIASGQNVCYNALQTITLAGGGTYFIVQNNGSVELVAGQNIIMLPGTRVDYGGYLLGRITTTWGYCGSMPPPMVATLTGEEEPQAEFAGANFSIYPNPTTGKFTLMQRTGNVNGPVNVEIYSLTGKRVWQADLAGAVKHEFDLHGLAAGLYILKVKKDERVETFKLILNR